MASFTKFKTYSRPIYCVCGLIILALILHTVHTPFSQVMQSQMDVPAPRTQELRVEYELLTGPDDPRDLRFYNIISEDEALEFEPCKDLEKAASPTQSRVKLLDRPGGNFEIGENIRIIVTLYDSHGNRKKAGGDQIRATIENSTLKAAAPCIITDNLDGTHLVECEALWTGTSEIVVTLAYTREAITSLYRIRNEVTATRNIYGMFKSRTFQEYTICHPNSTHLLRLTNYTKLCNMTYMNSGMPFYCGKPTNEHLLCQDWLEVRTHEPYPELPITECEEKLLNLGQRLLTKNLQVRIKSNILKRKKPILFKDLPSTPCSKYNVSLLWNSRKPSGFFYNGTWKLLNCRGIAESAYMPCLRNKHVYLFGDSTMRAWYKNIIDHLECEPLTEKWAAEKWHKESECYNSKTNFYAGWYPHSQPFFVGNGWDLVRYTQYSVARRIENIPANQQAIIVIQLYMHILAFHHSVFRERMMIIRKSVDAFLARSADSVVMIKGPHTYTGTPAGGIRLSDYYGYVYSKILYDVFEGLHDRVVLMNNRDTTLALHVKWNHPDGNIVNAMMNQMFSHACK